MQTIYYPENCPRSRPNSFKVRVKFSTVPMSSTELHEWFERDRASVELRHKRTNDTLIEWIDEDVSEAIEDGILNPRNFHGSAYQEYLSRQ